MKNLCVGVLVVVGAIWATPARAQAVLLPTLQAFRAQYPTPMTHAQRAELLNRVAWQHRAEGWGLLEKSGGTRCPAPQGLDVACDILMHLPTGLHWDVLVDHDYAAIPVWRLVGPVELWRFVAPAKPAQAVVAADMIADFGASGTWLLTDLTSYSLLHPLSPDSMVTGDLDGNNVDEIVLDLGVNHGVWAWMNNQSWAQLHPLSPTRMARGDLDANGRDDLLLDFPGYGVFVWANHTNWVCQRHLLAAAPRAQLERDDHGGFRWQRPGRSGRELPRARRLELEQRRGLAPRARDRRRPPRGQRCRRQRPR
jgi:hypothetical protein